MTIDLSKYHLIPVRLEEFTSKKFTEVDSTSVNFHYLRDETSSWYAIEVVSEGGIPVLKYWRLSLNVFIGSPKKKK